MTPNERLQNFVDSKDRVELESLFEFYDSLPAVDAPSMIGDWKGGVFNTGHAGEKQLGGLKWDGKAFHGPNDVDPIVSLDDKGTRYPNPVLGKASLRSVEYRGIVTATMVYDQHPVFDHFRRVSGDAVLGVMDRKGDAMPLFFWLRRMR